MYVTFYCVMEQGGSYSTLISYSLQYLIKLHYSGGCYMPPTLSPSHCSIGDYDTAVISRCVHFSPDHFFLYYHYTSTSACYTPLPLSYPPPQSPTFCSVLTSILSCSSVVIIGQPQSMHLPAMDLASICVSCTWLSAIQCHQNWVTLATTLQSVRKATQKTITFKNSAWAPLQTTLTSMRVSCYMYCIVGPVAYLAPFVCMYD